MNQAISQDNFTLADQLGKLALVEARKAREKELVVQAQGQITDVAVLAKAYDELKAAKVTLEKTPDDPDANLLVGKYLCFAKADWDKGLPMLALGSDVQVKALAKQELQGAASSDEQAKLGDAWWTSAEKQAGIVKKQMQARAGYWYQKALPELSGFMRLKVEKRVAELEKDDAKAPVDTDVHPRRPVRHAIPVKPQNNLRIVVNDAQVFNGTMASQFPASENKAGDGMSEASSKENGWGPKKCFWVPERATVATYVNSRGAFAARWAKPPTGRYILLFARTMSGGGKGSDPWGTATISVNGGKAVPLLGMACQMVAVIDLGQFASIQSVAISINGQWHPGLAGIEIHEGIPRRKVAMPRGHLR